MRRSLAPIIMFIIVVCACVNAAAPLIARAG